MARPKTRNRAHGTSGVGACGYQVKGADKAELIRSILAVADGQAVDGAPVARRIAELFGTARPATPAFSDPDPTGTRGARTARRPRPQLRDRTAPRHDR